MANKWRCGSCGYRLEADAPPEQCPGCREKCDFIDENPYIGVEVGGPATGEVAPEDWQPRVDAQKCNGCRDCVPACPVDAIVMREGIAWINPEDCVGDAACVTVCPVNAIRPPD